MERVKTKPRISVPVYAGCDLVYCFSSEKDSNTATTLNKASKATHRRKAHDADATDKRCQVVISICIQLFSSNAQELKVVNGDATRLMVLWARCFSGVLQQVCRPLLSLDGRFISEVI